MNLKKTLSLLMALVLIVSIFIGCQTGDDKAASETDTESSVSEASETEEDTVVFEGPADIVVIGAGGAGMTAAIQAVQDGATNVVVVEKQPMTGGNTTRSTGGLNAAATKYQEEEEIEDSVDLFIQDTMKSGKEINDPELVKVLAENSAGAVDWVNDIGGDLTVVGMLGGASVARAHRPSDTGPVGPMLVSALNKKMEELEIPVLLDTEATHIVLDDEGKVSGVTVKNESGEFTIDCKAAVLATGGFGANSEMVVKYNDKLEGFGTTNHPGATGDGIIMAEEIGAQLVDMEQIQTHPTVNPDTSAMYTEGVRGNGAILVNEEGKRFINEMETRDVVSEAILAQPDAYSWLVFDETVRESLKAIEDYISSGIIIESDTIEGLAEATGMNAENLKATMEAYAGYVEAGNDAEFGRNADSMLSKLDTPKFYAGKCVPAVHHTMGGVKINTHAQVISTEGNVIPGLMAAGEITGGVHGANRLGGNAVTDIVVFGRIAGTTAEAFVKGEEPAIAEAKDEVKDAAEQAKDAVESAAEAAGVDVKEAESKAAEAAKEVKDAAESAYEAADDKTKEAIKDAESKAADAAGAAVDAAKAAKDAAESTLAESKAL